MILTIDSDKVFAMFGSFFCVMIPIVVFLRGRRWFDKNYERRKDDDD